MIFSDPFRVVGWKRFAPLLACLLWLSASAVAVFLFQDSEGFARAGAVGAAFLLFGFQVSRSAYDAYLTKLQSTAISSLAHVQSTIPKIAAFSSLSENPIVSLKPDKAQDLKLILDMPQKALEFVKELEGAQERFRKVLSSQMVWETVLLVLATLQWGFGDLLMNRIMCGGWKC